MIVVISGKMFSGKDTLADYLERDLGGPLFRTSFSNQLIEEGKAGVEAMRACISAGCPQNMAKMVGLVLNLKPEEAEQFVSLLKEDVLDPKFTLRHRTTGSRQVLQHLGSGWRPHGYWAHKAVALARKHEAQGKKVYMVGGRYPVEHEAFTQAGAHLMRLDISREVQIERSLARDGIIPTEEQFNHRGETLLDSADFHWRFDTDHASADEVGAAAATWLRSQGVH